MYFKRAISMYKKLGSEKAQHNSILTYNNLGVTYEQAWEIDSAKHYFREAVVTWLTSASFPNENMLFIYESAENYFYNYGSDEELQELKNLRWVGQKAPEFNVVSPTGKIISLSLFRGKWVLLDFWASWCGPCLREVPNLKHIDSSFDIEILGISVDSEIDSWKYRMEEYALTWHQGLDNTESYGSTATKYGASRIPLTVVIDPNGIIKAYGLRGEALGAFIAEALKEGSIK